MAKSRLSNKNLHFFFFFFKQERGDEAEIAVWPRPKTKGGGERGQLTQREAIAVLHLSNRRRPAGARLDSVQAGQCVIVTPVTPALALVYTPSSV